MRYAQLARPGSVLYGQGFACGAQEPQSAKAVALCSQVVLRRHTFVKVATAHRPFVPEGNQERLRY